MNVSVTGMKMPICAVSGSKLVTENGWIELRNPGDYNFVFQLRRQGEKTYLQVSGSIREIQIIRFLS